MVLNYQMFNIQGGVNLYISSLLNEFVIEDLSTNREYLQKYVYFSASKRFSSIRLRL